MSDEPEANDLPDLAQTVEAEMSTSDASVAPDSSAVATESSEEAEGAVGSGVEESDGKAARAADLGLIMNVPLRLSVELGSAMLPVREVLELGRGSVVELDRMNGEPADVYVNDRLIARGELAVEDERVAVQITELVADRDTASAG